MLRVALSLTVLLSSFGVTMELRAADAPVKAFPANTGVVVRFADPGITMGKVKELIAVVEPDNDKQQTVSTYIDTASVMSGVIIDNPGKVGLKPKSDWWYAAIAKGGTEPPTKIIAVQPQDVAAVKDAVGEDYTYIEYENWLLYTKDEDAAKAIKACVSGDAASIEPAADETARSIFMKSDVAVFVNIKELVQVYQDELKMAREKADEALSEAENFAPPVEGIDLKAVFNMYRDMFSTLMTALEESNSCTIGISVSPQGIHADEYLSVKSDTKTSKILASHPQSALKILSMLPPKQPVYVGVSADMASLSKWGMELVKSMFGDEGEQADELEAALEKMKTLELGTYGGALGLGDMESGLFRSAAVSELKNAKQARKTYVEMFKAFSSFNTPLIKQTMEYKENAETIEGESVDTVTIKQEFDENIDPTGLQQQMVEKMYGPEGAVTRLMYLDNYVLQTMGGGSDALAALLKSVKSPTSDDAVAATRSQLAPEANLVALVDLPSLIVRGVYIAAEAGFLDASQIPEFDFDRSYIGYSVALSAKGIDVDAHVPAEQLKGLYMIGMTTYLMFSAQ